MTRNAAQPPPSAPSGQRPKTRPDDVVAVDVAALELLADRIAERLDERARARTGWVTADAVAVHLSVDVGYVYEHAAELGARRLGDGPKARLRFRLDLVDEALKSATTFSTGRGLQADERPPTARKRRPTRAPVSTSARSLPVRPVWGGPEAGAGSR